MKIVADVVFQDSESAAHTVVAWDPACVPAQGEVITGLDGNEYIVAHRRWKLTASSPGSMMIDRTPIVVATVTIVATLVHKAGDLR